MRTGIATVSLSGLLADKLPAIAAAGFDGIGALWDTRDNARAAANAARDHGCRSRVNKPRQQANMGSEFAAF